MADLTPEDIERLEKTAQRWIDTDGDMYDDDGRVAEALDALPALIAAAKERDQLRAEIESLRAPAPRKQATTISELFASRIREEGLPNYLVADRLRMSPTTVTDLLYGKKLPGPKLQSKLARFLRLTVEQLAAMVAEEKQRQPISHAEALP